MYIYQTGTTTELSLYSDEALSTAIANPIVADASGVFAQAFISEAAFKVVVTDADDVSLYSRDPVYSISNATSFAASAVTFDGSGIGLSATNVQDAIEESIDAITENPTFKDTSDNTKSITFDMSGITTATDRDITWPDLSGTPVLEETVITDAISGVIEYVDDQSYTLVVKTPWAGTITETTTVCASGTCTATFKINTTALGGTANSVSSSEQSQAHSSDNTFLAGDDIVLTASSNSSCLDMSFTIKFTRTIA